MEQARYPYKQPYEYLLEDQKFKLVRVPTSQGVFLGAKTPKVPLSTLLLNLSAFFTTLERTYFLDVLGQVHTQQDEIVSMVPFQDKEQIAQLVISEGTEFAFPLYPTPKTIPFSTQKPITEIVVCDFSQLLPPFAQQLPDISYVYYHYKRPFPTL